MDQITIEKISERFVSVDCKKQNRALFATVYSVCIALSLALSAGQIQAAEPTLSETIEYINTKFAQCKLFYMGEDLRSEQDDIAESLGVGYKGMRVKVNVRLLESDRILVEENVLVDKIYYDGDFLYSWYGETITNTTEVNLHDLTTEVEYNGLYITFNCSRVDCIHAARVGEKVSVKNVGKDGAGRNKDTDRQEYKIDDRTNETRGFIPVCADSGEQIAEALTHAITISGGKDELF